MPVQVVLARQCVVFPFVFGITCRSGSYLQTGVQAEQYADEPDQYPTVGFIRTPTFRQCIHIS